MIVQWARPNSRAGALCTWPPSASHSQLHAVADAQHRNAELKQFRIAMRRAGFIDAGRPAGKNQSFGRNFAHPRGRDVVPHDFAVNILLAHPPGMSCAYCEPKSSTSTFSSAMPVTLFSDWRMATLISLLSRQVQTQNARGVFPGRKGGLYGLQPGSTSSALSEPDYYGSKGRVSVPP